MGIKTRHNYGRRYVEQRIRQKRRRKWQMKIFLACMFIFAGVIVISAGKKEQLKVQNVKEDQVAAAELAGYLQAAFLTPEETRKLVLPEVHDPLTGEDVQVVLQKLGMENSWEEFEGLLKVNGADSQEVVSQQNLTRETWCQCYELLLEKLQVKDSVTEMELQYLGKVPGEQRIMAL